MLVYSSTAPVTPRLFWPGNTSSYFSLGAQPWPVKVRFGKCRKKRNEHLPTRAQGVMEHFTA
jgi:hypothetical protein